jgi:hypothetical protein
MAVKVIHFTHASTGIGSQKYAAQPVDPAREGLFYFEQPSILAHPVRSRITSLLPVSVDVSAALYSNVYTGIGGVSAGRHMRTLTPAGEEFGFDSTGAWGSRGSS